MDYARLDGALLTVKAVDSDRRWFAGLATTPHLDRHGHSVDPAGVSFTNPIPLLFEHGRSPVGYVTLSAPTAEGVAFEATIPTIPDPGPLRDEVDRAWQLVKHKLIKSVSIGFQLLADAVPITGVAGGLRLLKTEIVELSLVSIPANPQAAILLVKSLALPGREPAALSDGSLKRCTAMTLTEQIRSYETTRAAAAADMAAIMAAAVERGETLDPTDQDRYDALDTKVKSFDDFVQRLKRTEQLQTLTPAPAAPGPRPAAIQVKSNLPPGALFTRAMMSLVRCNFNRHEAAQDAAGQWTDTPEVALWLKAAVAPGTTTDPAWAGALVAPDQVSREFVDLLRPATVLGKIALQRVPFGVTIPILTSGGIYGWTGQGAPKKVTKLGFATDKLPVTKATGIIVLTDELVRSSNPDAETICRNAMVKGIAAFLDQQFLDPAVAAVANISPGSITNGTVALTATTNPLADIHALLNSFSVANIPLGGVTIVMSESNALALGMIRNGNGDRLFSGVDGSGGSVDGIKVVTSNVAGSNVIALQPDLVIYSDYGGVQIDMSREASLQMDDAPMHPADATTVYTNLFQNNLVALRAERYIGWKRIKLEAVKYTSGATYAPTTGAPAGTFAAGGGGGSTRGSSAKQG